MKKSRKIKDVLVNKWSDFYHRVRLRHAIWIFFTLPAALSTILIGVSMSTKYNNQLNETIQNENQTIIDQVNGTLGDYLQNMMKISDTLYYNVIKNKDLADPENSLLNEFELLYDANKEAISSIALFLQDGTVLEVHPAAKLKEQADVTELEWFQTALDKSEYLHFSDPHVQNLYVTGSVSNQWVISLSRAVQVNMGNEVVSGVLLVDLNYSRLETIFKNTGLGNTGYVYLINGEGEIIYHPDAQLVYAGVQAENHQEMLQYKNESFTETFEGQKRYITVKQVGYTGWRVVGVMPEEVISENTQSTYLFFILLCLLLLVILAMLNSYISSKVTIPISNLERSVGAVAEGDLDTRIEIAGFQEIKHLGTAIQKMTWQIRRLMDAAVKEEKQKRKSELDILQSQINPHFLYNTLDIIVWMIENEKKSEAVRTVMALSRLFRISLSKGNTIIRLEDELEHARNYLEIQAMRYKDRFEYSIEMEAGMEDLACIKLVLQPLIENAIYHGLEALYDEGEIRIKCYQRDGHLYVEVQDNGIGMRPEQVDTLLTGQAEDYELKKKNGSGIGVKNVHERIRLYFGEDYGLAIASEPDEGTTITVHLPAVPYAEWKERS